MSPTNSATLTPNIPSEAFTFIALYPNPLQIPNQWGGRVHYVFRLPAYASGNATLSVFDLAAEKVAQLAPQTVQPGINILTWDGTNDAGRPCASGSYLLRLEITGAGLSEKDQRWLGLLR